MTLKKNIVSSTIQVTLITFVIKLLGVFKQSLIASKCGATAETDAYFIASSIILALCLVLFSSISITLLSLYTDKLVKLGKKEANELICMTLFIFVPISILITTTVYLFSPQLAQILAPSYSGEHLNLLIQYIKALSVLFVFNCYYLILNVILETNKEFLPGKMQNLFQNIFIIVSIILVYPKEGINSLIYSLILASIVNCIYITYKTKSYFKDFRLKKNDCIYIKKLLKLSIPLLAGNAIYEINDIVDKQIASSLSKGSVSILTYGASINEIVTTLIISSVSVVLFSHYATWASENNTVKIEKNFKNSIGVLITILIPVTVICIIFGDLIVKILYGRGNFDSNSIQSTYLVISGYAIGFVFQAIRANLIKVFYAFQDTKTPMYNGAIAIVCNIGLSITLTHFFGIIGIPLATSISMCIVSILLLPKLKRYMPCFSIQSLNSSIKKSIISGIIVSCFAFIIKKFVLLSPFLVLTLGSISIIISYVFLLLFMRQQITWIFVKKLINFVKKTYRSDKV